MEKHKVQISHKGETLEFGLRHGLGLQALESSCPWLEFDCRKADCGICIVRVREGAAQLSSQTPAEKDFLRAMHAQDNERLACQCRVFGSVELEIDDYA